MISSFFNSMYKEKNRIFWKVGLILLSILILFFEIDSYTNTRGSIGQLILYPNQDKVMFIGSTAILISGIAFIFAENRFLRISSFVIIVLTLLLFYPSFDMQGVDHAL